MNWNTWGNCKELFWLTNDILIFIDTMTDYVWVYDTYNGNVNFSVFNNQL